jgi:L-asparaginase
VASPGCIRPAAVTRLPSVTVLTLGGTIASSADPGAGATIKVSGAELMRSIPQASAFADVRVRTLRMVPSADLRLRDIADLRAVAQNVIGSGAHGVVVTQGTDTMEETSYALDLLAAFDEPVIFTGSMRNLSVPGSDAPANLLAAIQVAACPAARGAGVLVVMNDEIHAARHVRKRHTTATSSFGSPLTGPLGYISERRVRMLTRPAGRLHVPVPTSPPECRVAQVVSSFDDDGQLIRAVPGLGYQGLVLAAFGGGHVPGWIAPILAEVCERIPVVLASRTSAGEVLQETYAFPGAEMDLIARGLIPAAGLDAAHSTVLLRLLLMAGVPRQALAWCFEQAMSASGPVTAPVENPTVRTTHREDHRSQP